ncbi:MAG: carboxypeptidase regulatory-like domain-containing protein [Planctomycetaceae bacterium]|nr:carboxypeptidase regulatory-like domain-containing protein [Planctomycetaceae bacterium]
MKHLSCGLILSVILFGCGSSGPEIASVEGTVTLDGQPLANASVVFVPEGGRPAGASTDAQGKYVLNFSEDRQGAIPGKNVVRISTARGETTDDNGQMVPGSPETIPAKYNAQTTLEFNVEPGKVNTADFTLESEGELPAVSDTERD